MTLDAGGTNLIFSAVRRMVEKGTEAGVGIDIERKEKLETKAMVDIEEGR